MVALTNGRAFLWWLLTAALLVAADWILGWPVPAGLLPIGVGLIAFVPRVIADGFVSGQTARALAARHDYVLRQQIENNSALDINGLWILRESLDEAGQHACDLVAGAMERRDSPEGSA